MTHAPRTDLIVVVLMTLAQWGCADRERSPHTMRSTAAQQHQDGMQDSLISSGVAVFLDTIATNLEVPWSLDFAPDGRVFITERTGRVRVIENGELRPDAWAELPVFAREEHIRPESGLLGIALAPDFATSGHVFVLGTFWKRSRAAVPRAIDRIFRRVAGVFSARAAVPYENRVYRLTDRGARGIEAVVVIDDLPSNHYHAGGALAFGPDGNLYVGVGEALASASSDDPAHASGQILRYRRDGSIPDDNPIAGSPLYALGLRNPQAIAWHPQADLLIATEHGPTQLPHENGRSDQDELNVIAPGASYGWPAVTGRAGDARFVDPVVVWSPAIAPAGLAFYTGSHAKWHGDAFVGALRGLQLRRVAFDSAALAQGRLSIAQQEILLSQTVGRIRAVRMAPDGHLWITTSNRDGRGVPSPHDDLVLRVRFDASECQPRSGRSTFAAATDTACQGSE